MCVCVFTLYDMCIHEEIEAVSRYYFGLHSVVAWKLWVVDYDMMVRLIWHL